VAPRVEIRTKTIWSVPIQFAHEARPDSGVDLRGLVCARALGLLSRRNRSLPSKSYSWATRRQGFGKAVPVREQSLKSSVRSWKPISCSDQPETKPHDRVALYDARPRSCSRNRARNWVHSRIWRSRACFLSTPPTRETAIVPFLRDLVCRTMRVEPSN
jgi:hypothetical protein